MCKIFFFYWFFILLKLLRFGNLLTSSVSHCTIAIICICALKVWKYQCFQVTEMDRCTSNHCNCHCESYVKLLEVGSTQIHVDHKPEWLLTTNLSIYPKTPMSKRHIHKYFILDLCHTTTMWERKQIWSEVSDVLLTWH